MKEQYFGDIRDFVKYSLLRSLASNDSSLGICWMMTPDDTRSDGNKNEYLWNDDHRDIDPELFTALRILTPIRHLSQLRVFELSGLLRDAVFYSPMVPATTKARADYFSRANNLFQNVDLVFIDPDNGVTPSKTSKESPKHVTLDECLSFQKPVLVYQHRPMMEKLQDTVKKLFGMFNTTHVAAITEPDVVFCLATNEERFVSRLEQFVKNWKQAGVSPKINFHRKL